MTQQTPNRDLADTVARLERTLGTVRALAAAAAAVGLVGVALAAFALSRPVPVQQAVPAPAATAPAAPAAQQGAQTQAPPEMIRVGTPADAGAAPQGTIVLGAAGQGHPVLDIYEDFQCPACASIEKFMGPQVAALVADGRIEVRYHMMSFLDQMLRNDSSVRAAAGGFCAHEQGGFEAYHDVLYGSAHPKNEGDGWTDDQLKAAAGAAKLDVEKWSACVAANKYTADVTAANELSLQAGVNSTPTFKLNGTKLNLQTVLALGGLGKVVDANR